MQPKKIRVVKLVNSVSNIDTRLEVAGYFQEFSEELKNV